MERYTGNEFAKSVNVYISIVIIINNVLGHNIQSTHKHNWEDSTTIYMISYITTYRIGQDGSKIAKSEVKTKTRLNSGRLQTLTGLWNL